MTKKDRNWMEEEIRTQLRCAVSDDYDRCILDHYVDEDETETVMDCIIDDIVETSGYLEDGCFSSSDVRYAIGRVLCDLIGVTR